MRLIDADALYMYLEKRKYYEKDRNHAYLKGVRDCMKDVTTQPTIKLDSKWIPCSKRLPNENDYRECMECLDGAVWYFTENGTMGLGYYYESTKEWATIGELSTDGKVIAWKPLPGSYQEVEE